MGGLAMLIVIIILAVILNIFLETYLAIIIAIITFIAWFLFNQRSASVGLFKSNLFAYKKGISSGMNREEAISFMISTRYPERHPDTVISDIKTLYLGLLPLVEGRFSEPDSEIKIYLCALFCYENGIPFNAITTKLQNKYIAQIEKEYDILFS